MMLIAGLTTAIGVGALLVAIGYRLFRSDGSVQITDVTATLPKGRGSSPPPPRASGWP
jgi:hypothetical protein